MRRNTADIIGKMRMWNCGYATNEWAYAYCLPSLHFCCKQTAVCLTWI